jgi:hypothetical protein
MGSRVADVADLSILEAKFLRYSGMFSLVPAQKNYFTDLDFRL